MSRRLSPSLKRLFKMAMLMLPRGRSTSTSGSIKLNLNMGNSKGSRRLKQKPKKLMSRVRRIRRILLCGKLPSRKNQSGNRHGVMEGQDGTSNAQQWLTVFWVEIWTSTPEVLTSSSLTTRTKWPSHRLSITILIGYVTSSMWVI